jgi:hypothetical protein
MTPDDDNGGNRDSWGQILSRCGPGLAEGDEAPVTPHAFETDEKRPQASIRPRITRARIAILIGLTLMVSVAIPQGLMRQEQERAGTGNKLATASIAALPSTLVSREPLAGDEPSKFVLNGQGPASSSEGSSEVAGNKVMAVAPPPPSATDSVGGPFLPAESSAGIDETARPELQARLPRPDVRKLSEQPANTDDPAAAAALKELRLRQDFDEAELPPLLEQSSSFSTKDAQTLIDRGKNLMSLGDVVTARLIFQKVMESGYAEGTFHLARSYDPEVLEALPLGAFVKGDVQKAKMLYALAEKTEKTISRSQ